MSEAPRVEVAFGLGSNIGDKAAHIREAMARLAGDGIVSDLACSRLYRTAPWGNLDQDWFVNACAVGWTALPPLDLLARVKALEIAIGRTATVRWGPRVIDIDLLYYGDLSIATPTLTLPHRDLADRAFVLRPLADLRPDFAIGGRSVKAMLTGLDARDIAPLDAGSA